MPGRTPIVRHASRRSRLTSQQTSRAFVGWLGRGSAGLFTHILGFAAAGWALAMCIQGELRGPAASGLEAIAVLGLLGLLLVARVLQHLTPREGGLLEDLELVFLVVGGALAAVEVGGGPTGPLQPLVYLLVAFLAAYFPLGLGSSGLAVVLASGAAATFLATTPDGWPGFGARAAFVALFGLGAALLVRPELQRRRERLDSELADRLAELTEEGRSFRLMGSSAAKELSPQEKEERRVAGSVDAIRQSLYNLLAVAERALEPHTVALLWLDDKDGKLGFRELRSASDHIAERRFGAGEGICGAVLKGGPVVLTRLKPGAGGLVYYQGAEPVTDFAGVRVMDGVTPRGILVADRVDGTPFDEADVALLTTLASEVVRAVEVERVFRDLHVARDELSVINRAAEAFNSARSVHDVAEAALAAVAHATDAEVLGRPEFVGVAVSLGEPNRMRVEAVQADRFAKARDWAGRELDVSQSLVATAIKRALPMPVGTERASNQPVFGAGLDLDLPAVKVFPLVAAGKGIGALVLASSRPTFLPDGALQILDTIGRQAATALENAQLFEHNERLATTDGLTGLANHRTFQSSLEQMLAQAERYGRKLSMLLMDIDHFKSVNDTYGHPVGDKVLKRVAALVAQTARARIDVCARYGGEEFAVVLPETDRAGALRLAERIREAVAAEVFPSENGTFRSSVSIGVSTFPEDATQKAELVDCADQSLYAAKRAGRNRCITFDMLKSQREQSA